MNAKPPRSILFVCLGNICRSPLAEGIFCDAISRRGLDGFDIESAGTGGWHAGSPPDLRSIEIAARYGVDISAQRARMVAARDFRRFDLILGMDRSNVASLAGHPANSTPQRVALFMEFATGEARDIPDPYHGGSDGFLPTYRMILSASEALAEKLAAPGRAPSSGHASSTT